MKSIRTRKLEVSLIGYSLVDFLWIFLRVTLYLLRVSAMVQSSEEASSACQKRLHAGLAKQVVLE